MLGKATAKPNSEETAFQPKFSPGAANRAETAGEQKKALQNASERTTHRKPENRLK